MDQEQKPAVVEVAEVVEGVGYTDFILRSTLPTYSTGWKYNLMKFNTMADKVVDPAGELFNKPVRLNRKDPRTVRRLNDEDIERINRGGIDLEMEDGTLEGGIIEEEIKPLKKVKEEIDLTLVGTGLSGLAAPIRSKSTMFQKKTKRVFVSSEEARRLKREEWMPWVLEDATATERWIGRLEGGTGEQPLPSSSSSVNSYSSAAAKSTAAANAKGTGMTGWRPPPVAGDIGSGGSSYVAFVFGESGEDFKVIPTNRWYKFNQGPKYVTLGTDEAEDQFNRQEKKQDADRWIMHKRPNALANKASAEASTSSLKRESTPDRKFATGNIRSRMLAQSEAAARSTTGLAVPGSRLKTVLIGNNDGEGSGQGGGRKQSGSKNRADQEDDEFDYEVDFQDDEEGIAKIDDMADEEETRELEKRIKKEMQAVDRLDDRREQEDRNTDSMRALNFDGKAIKKLFKKVEKNTVYESDGDDDELNPYLSQDEVDSDGDSIASNDTTKPPTPLSKSTDKLRRQHSSRPSSVNSRTGSPALSRSGSSIVAKRATSPSHRHSNPGSRSNSPNRSRESSPGLTTNGSSKRRRGESEGVEGQTNEDGSKRRKPGSPSTNSNPNSPSLGSPTPLITEADIIALLKTRPSFQTKDVLAHFKKALKGNPANKLAIGGMLMSVASLVEGNLVLRPDL